MLESVKRAYDKGAFDQTSPGLMCPVDLKKIEIYLQILKPAYQVSIGLQSNQASIACLIPGLLRFFNIWERMKVDQKETELCILLVKCFKNKFEYELNSFIYKVIEIS